MSKRFVATAVLAATLFIAACSGSNGTTPPPPSGPAPDTTPPVITLNGPANIALPFASAYEDEGASATDNVDGAVAVTVAGSVDPFTPGSYTLTFTARDAAGNTATATRTVTVANRQVRLTVSSFGAANFTAGGAALACNTTGDICFADVDVGTELSVTGQVGPGWSFEYWRQCDAASGISCTVTMDEDRLVLFTASRPDPIQLVPEAVLLTNAQVDAIRNFDPASDSIFFAAGAPTANIAVGSIIVADGRRNLNISFARRVVEILALPGAPTLVKTVNVSLDDLVLEGTFLGRPQDFAVSLPGGSTLPGGGAIRGQGAAEPIREVVNLAEIELYNENGTKVTLSGSITVNFTPEIAIDATVANGIRSFRFSGESTVESALQLNFTGPIDGLAFKQERPLAKINAGYVIVGPAVFVVELQPILFAEGGLNASITPGVSLRQVSLLGVQYHTDSGWTNLSRFNTSGSVQFADTVTAGVTFEVGGGLSAAVELWSLAGPFVRGDIFGGGEALVRAPPAPCPVTTKIWIGARAIAGGQVSAFSRRLDVKVGELSFKKPLASGSPGCTADQEPPTAPVNLVASTGSSSTIRLAWGAATDNRGVASYEIWRRDTNGGRAQQVTITDGLTFTDSNLRPSQQYCYYLIAVDTSGNKSPIPAAFACATTFNAVDDTPPTAPQLTGGEALSTSTIELTWTAATDNEGIGGYYIIDVTAGDTAAFAVSDADGLTGTVSRLSPDTEYCYRVVARDLRGNLSPASNRICVTTLPRSEAAWTVFLGCQGREFLLDAQLDLDETINSRVEVAGSGFDYPGTPLTYQLIGIYDSASSLLSADIFWTFANTSSIRQDRFSASLSTGNSGIVAMQQIQVTGCDAQVQIVKTSTGPASVSNRPAAATPGASRLALGSGPVR